MHASALSGGVRQAVHVAMVTARLLLATIGPAQAEERPSVSQVQAEALAGTFYGGLNAGSADQAAPLLDRPTSFDWQNCASDDACISQAAVLQRWASRFAVVPDHRWQEREVLVPGERIIVRGQESATPIARCLGVAPTGRSLPVMTTDIHDVRDRKIVRTRHVKDWASAIRQLAPSQ